jgi:hypothetical protein
VNAKSKKGAVADLVQGLKSARSILSVRTRSR